MYHCNKFSDLVGLFLPWHSDGTIPWVVFSYPDAAAASLLLKKSARLRKVATKMVLAIASLLSG